MAQNLRKTAQILATLLITTGVLILSAKSSLAQEGDSNRGRTSVATRQIEEIVVRARKRAELLEETPISVSAIGAGLLKDVGVTQINQIENLVPNTTIRTGGLGQQIRIRGVGASSSGIAFDPGVGIYLDGVYIPRSRRAVVDLVDIQQIEVLRGPQGTVFGKNTVGGAISVSSVKPKLEREASLFIRPGNFDTVNLKAMLNLPLGSGWLEDKLALRTAFRWNRSGGFVFNETRDQHVSDNDSKSFIASVRFQPTEDLTLDLSGSYARFAGDGPGGQCVFMETQQLTALIPGLEEACNDTRPFRVQLDTDQGSRNDDKGVWATLRYDLGDIGGVADVSLKSLTSWREQNNASRLDLDGTRLFVVNLNSRGEGPGLQDGTPGSSRQIQQEVQLNVSALEGRLQLVNGVFLYWEDSEAGNTVLTSIPTGIHTLINTDNFTWALFSQGTMDVTSWLSLTAGIRYTEDEKTVQQTITNATVPDQPTGGGGAGRTFDSWTPMASVSATLPPDWLDEAPVEHLMAYFTYARGFKGGGVNAAVQVATGVEPEPFDPEILDNFEVGLKTILDDRRLTLNLAYFYGKYDEIQLTQQRTLQNDSGEPVIQRLTQNAAEATTQGVELEFMARPIPGLLVQGTMGFLDTEFDRFPDALSDLTGAPIDRSGQSFNSAPRWNTYLAIQYMLPLALGGAERPWLDGVVLPRVDWAWRDSQHVLGPEVEAALVPSYHLLGARLAYRFAEGRAEIALWGRNLLDEAYFSTAFTTGGTYGTALRWFQLRRTFGAELTYRFTAP